MSKHLIGQCDSCGHDKKPIIEEMAAQIMELHGRVEALEASEKETRDSPPVSQQNADHYEGSVDLIQPAISWGLWP